MEDYFLLIVEIDQDNVIKNYLQKIDDMDEFVQNCYEYFFEFGDYSIGPDIANFICEQIVIDKSEISASSGIYCSILHHDGCRFISAKKSLNPIL